MKVKAFILMLAGMLVACGGSAPPSVATAAKSARDAKKPEPVVDAIPGDVTTPYEYSYSPIGKRDPFRSVLDDIAERAVEGSSTRSDCGQLCKWELEQLKLVAVISGMSNPLGMVEDPNGKGYIVRRGTFVGKRNGKVTQIRAGEVVVTEVFKDQMGKPHMNPVVIKLPADTQQAEQEETNLLNPEVAE